METSTIDIHQATSIVCLRAWDLSRLLFPISEGYLDSELSSIRQDAHGAYVIVVLHPQDAAYEAGPVTWN
jgi:hypothetical protein